MAPKISTSKDTTKSSTSEAVESMLMNLLVYSYTQLFIEKESDITWKKVNEEFSVRSLKENLEDEHVYISV